METHLTLGYSMRGVKDPWALLLLPTFAACVDQHRLLAHPAWRSSAAT
jgi:hypothetical protein